MPPSAGEALTAAWLRQRGFGYEREPEVGKRRPDFVVDSELGRFAVEVYEPHLELPREGHTFSSYPTLRNAFRGRKKKQASEARRQGLPCLVVVGNTNSEIEFSAEVAAGAMLGDLATVIPFDVGNPGDHAWTVFGGNRQVLPDKNRGVSALGIITRFNPTFWRVEALRSDLEHSWGRPRSWRDIGLLMLRLRNEWQGWVERGVADEHAAVVRMAILHNPFAELPLAPAVAGHHDEQWGMVVDDAGRRIYGPVAEGCLSRELPDRWNQPMGNAIGLTG